MRLADWIRTLLRVPCGRLPEGGRFCRRVGAGGGVTILVSGFFAALGLGNVVEIGLATAVLALVLAFGMAAAPRLWRAMGAGSPFVDEARVRWRQAGDAVRKLRASAGAGARAGTSRADEGSDGAGIGLRSRIPRDRLEQLQRTTAAQARAVGARLRRLGRSAEHVGARSRRLVAAGSGSLLRALRQREGARRRGTHTPPAPAPVPGRSVHGLDDALRLNAAGVRLRREGSPAEAAEQHRAALTILRELGDERSVALTLNNLALALSHVGDDAAAVEFFHEAAAILGGLGDEQHEGQVIANLGLAHRRHGRGEEAENVLQLALAKLAPASSEYRTIEAELRRAS